MSEQSRRNPYMDYRNVVPFMDLSGFVVRQPHALEEKPAMSLQEELMKKKFAKVQKSKNTRYKLSIFNKRNTL